MALTINLGLTADATGTVDVITATYSPAPTLVDNKVLFLQTTGTNTGAVTFNPNSLGAKAVVINGSALTAGKMPKFAILAYDLDNTRWELLNPISSGSGGGETLAQTLALGNSTGANDIIINDNQSVKASNSTAMIVFADSYMSASTDGDMDNEGYWFLTDARAVLGYSTNIIDMRSAYINFLHSTLLKLNAPSVEMTQETASRILSLDANKYIKGLDTATYPSLTELSYAKGVTSAIQTQINLKAPLASPALTGSPTAPTQTANDNSTKIATTAYVDAASPSTVKLFNYYNFY